MKLKQVKELVLQALEHEKGGVEVYTTALKCAVVEDLKEEWEKYLAETELHVTTLEGVCKELGFNPDEETTGRAIARHLGKSLVEAMEMAIAAGDPAAAEVVACECVVIAETKDHLNWHLIGKCAEDMDGKAADVLEAAHDLIEGQEDEHLYHTKGWCRELWMESLGLDAIIPPLEETRHVTSAIAAAKAEQASDEMR
jgi:hypothetical protein